MTALTDSYRGAALDIVGDVLQWRHHAPTGWREVDDALTALAQAVDNHDNEAVDRITTTLELLAPRGCARRIDPDAVPTPEATARTAREITAKLADLPDAQGRHHLMP